jgi:hypothetical protein
MNSSRARGYRSCAISVTRSLSQDVLLLKEEIKLPFAAGVFCRSQPLLYE